MNPAVFTRLRRAAGSVALALLVVAAPACGGGVSVADEATPAKQIKQLPADLVPGDIRGLKVTREDMSTTLEGVTRSYTDAIGLYSFRRDDLLQATLQITRFNDEADWKNPRFRSSVVSQIGGSVPQRIRVGDDTVYLTRGTKQSLSIWFRGQHLLVLAVREEFLEPRALLRDVLELEPKTS